MPKLERDKIQGDHPADIGTMPGEIILDQIASPRGLEKLAENYLATHPSILRHARESGQDLIAHTSANGKRILIGVGIATAIVGGITLYSKRHSNSSRQWINLPPLEK